MDMYDIRKPCGHPGCLQHTTHPCEVCGRVAGMEPIMVLQQCPKCGEWGFLEVLEGLTHVAVCPDCDSEFEVPPQYSEVKTIIGDKL